MRPQDPLFPHPVTLVDGTTVLQRDLGSYLLDFHPGTNENAGILFITFENRASGRLVDNRLPWGFPFLQAEGFSILGVKARQADWYRDPVIADIFTSAAFSDFTATFRRVIFYGGSMGGTGALALATPGAEVLVISPQVTLDPMLSAWETRYDEARAFDWSGDCQAAAGAARASAVYALYDPFERLDCRHLAQLPQATLRPLKLPFLGHGVPDWVTHTGLLKDLVRLVARAALTSAAWHQLARRRRLTPDYAARMMEARPTPCVKQLCLAEGLKQWWRLANDDPNNIQLQLHVMDLLTKTGQWQPAQAIGQRIQALLDRGALPPQ